MKYHLKYLFIVVKQYLNLIINMINCIYMIIVIKYTTQYIIVRIISWTWLWHFYIRNFNVNFIYVQEAIRVVPFITAKQLFINRSYERKNSETSYIPLKINQGGVMPLIFSSTFLTFLTVGINFLLRGNSIFY